MIFVINLLACIAVTIADIERIDVSNETLDFGQTRRILNGREVHDTRPYMVYLRPAANADSKVKDTNWLCGAVIIHERYVLTSAACIEDVKHFYVISGTHKWVAATDKTNECVNNGGKKAIWKCVPKYYFYDGDDYDNIRWMVGDVAVVKVEDSFNFHKRVRGCDFIPKMIGFNNKTLEFENAGVVASVAGWGATEKFGDVIARASVNSLTLQEADVVVMSNKNCKNRWDSRYHFIIDGHMICTREITDDEVMGTACLDEVNCKELTYTDEEDPDNVRIRRVLDPAMMRAQALDGRRTKTSSGGFCENDHGGPLVYGQGKSAMVIGVISACQTMDVSHKCHGPFLFTSVYRNRNLINCAINKDIGMEPTCRRLLKSTKTQMIETKFNWTEHPDGPPKYNPDGIPLRSRLYNFPTTDLSTGMQETIDTTPSRKK